MKSFLEEQDIKVHNSSPYKYDLNGIAEILNPTIVTKICIRLHNFAKSLWQGCVVMVRYLYNFLNYWTNYCRVPYDALHCIPLSSTTHHSLSCWKPFLNLPQDTRARGLEVMSQALEIVPVRYTKFTTIFHSYIPSNDFIVVTGKVFFLLAK